MTDESTDLSPVLGTSRKRKRIDPSELCQTLYDSIRNVKKEDGSTLCDTFIRAPKRRQEPSYYEVVVSPIDLLRIQQKLKTESYDDVDELTIDFELLVNNAKAFYKPDSSEYMDAVLLWETFLTNKSKLVDSYPMNIGDDEHKSKKIGRPRKSATNEPPDDASETSSKAEDDFEIYEELFSAVMSACDDNQRPLHIMFQLLPSKKLYSDYYDIIEHPIDLKFIATKIQTNAYGSLNEIEKDLLQMTKNACTFNEPGSQIYKDAKTLKRIITTKRQELESGKFKSIKPKRKGSSMSASIAMLKEPIEDSDDDIDENVEAEGSGPMWQLFDQLYNTANASDHHNATGAPLGESLWKLPNRRFHPEYYSTIKKPISMSQIRKKLKKGDYINITDLTADLYVMLDNAIKAFPFSHKVHKDAMKMQKILNQKLVDAAVDQEDSDMDDSESNSPLSISKKKGRPRTQSVLSGNGGSGGGGIANTNSCGVIIGGGGIGGSGSASSSGINSMNNNSTTGNSTVITMANTSSLSNSNMSNTSIIVQPPAPAILVPQNSTPKARFPNNPILKKKLLGLQKFLSDYTVAGRRPMQLFMEKPSKKAYPDYYEIIQHPIDMNTIKNNIENDRYGTLDDVVGDFRLMFLNCRKYNEEGSQIFEDSNILERALNEKLKEFSGINDRRLTPKIINKGRKNLTPMYTKLRQLYDAIRDFRETKANRQLALIFMKLPSKNDYPDYYDIIKNPIDMEKIAYKLKTQFYDNVDELATDFMLMFENACKYNEPDSQIYKDALVLQQICIQTKQTLRDADECVPDVPQAVQEILLSLFTCFYNHQDEEGRCFSDSLAELPEYEEVDGQKVRAISLDLIKRRLDKLLYKRLDMFQEDVFSCFERARKLSRTDSQIFEDSIELQSFFIRKRDELCKDVLASPALSYTAMHLSAAVEALRQTKLLQEEQEQEQENEIAATQGESMTINQKVYTPGDFVYYDIPDNKLPGVIYIERLWTNPDDIKMMYGNVFLRPFETYHVTTRKFLEQEVFKSEQHIAVPLSQLNGKCCVLSAKDYFKYKPEGFADKDVFVCESRYNMKLRNFKKIKVWPFADNQKLQARDTPLEPKRVMSVFKERVEKHKGELAELQMQEAVVEKEKPNVIINLNSTGDDDNVYYEQYNTICSGVVKTGDFVYIATENGKQAIAQITSIWETKTGKSFVRGPWLLTPPEVPVSANRYFYRQELLLSTLQETSPVVAIVGRCTVLECTEYSTIRPTEIAESDVFVCESIYDEHKKQIRRNPQGMSGLRKFTHSQLVTPDEVYHFKRSIIPVKVSVNEIAALQEQLRGGGSMMHTTMDGSDITIKQEGMSAGLMGLGGSGAGTSGGNNELFGLMEDSMDGGGPPSVGSDMAANSSPAPLTGTSHATNLQTPISTQKKKEKKSKLVTGYILYSSEVRKDRAQNNPDCSFGDISRLVGNEWRTLPAYEKQVWEERAAKCNEENAVKFAEENGCASPAPQASTFFTAETLPNQIFECLWNKCDWQFEDPMDCFDHCIAENTGHVQSYFATLPAEEIEFNCLWRNCIRMKKNAPPFPHLIRLIKHVREVHINKSGRIVPPADRSKNLMPSKKLALQAAAAAAAAGGNPMLSTSGGVGNVNNINGNQKMIQQPQHQQQQQQQSQQQQQNMLPVSHLSIPAPPAEPLFVTVPPRPQRVLHSEAYIKYIEGLQNETRFTTPWEKTLNVSQETAPKPDMSKLPVHWFKKSMCEKPEDAVNALWQLRDFMISEVLNSPYYP